MKASPKAMLLSVVVFIFAANTCSLAHTDVTAQQAKNLIDSTSDLIVIDVREPHEYCDTRGHIPGALNYPWYAGVLRARYEELPIDGPILVICRSGGRSNAAANFLDSNGFSMVYDMLGGMSAWEGETEPCKYSGGTGTADDPYQIATAADLNSVGTEPDDWDKQFKLTADIDLSEYNGTDFNIIGSGFGNAFAGVFDGHGHNVKNLTIIDPSRDQVGLFGHIGQTSRVSDVHLVNVNVEGKTYVGSLVGYSTGTVSNCSATGNVRAWQYTGGLIGINMSSAITENCHTSVNVSGEITTGGLVGANSKSMISNCSAAGFISGTSTTGGITGRQDYGTILNSYSNCIVLGTGTMIGGLVGRNNYSLVSGCFAAGEVLGNQMVGGLVGFNDSEISNSYSSAKVAGSDSIGGLLGYNIYGYINFSFSTSEVHGIKNAGAFSGYDYGTCLYTSCFWDADIQTSLTGISNATEPGLIGVITKQMREQTTFSSVGWDFMEETINGTDDIWWILEGRDYPRLWWEYPGHVFEVEIALGTDYEDPDDPNDTVHEFELTVVTDGSVQRVSFITPAGGMYKIPNLPQYERPVPGGWLETAREYDDRADVYEWSYELKLDKPKVLTDYGDGSYEIITYYEDDSQQQTTAWFGVPGTDQPITHLFRSRS